MKHNRTCHLRRLDRGDHLNRDAPAASGPTVAPVPFAGMVAFYVWLFQLNVVIPPGVGGRDAPLSISVNEFRSNRFCISPAPPRASAARRVTDRVVPLKRMLALPRTSSKRPSDRALKHQSENRDGNLHRRATICH